MYCRKCGNQLRDDAVFCDKCGTKVSADFENEKVESQGKRKQVYEGVIHKCPNCGHTLNSYTLICPKCGYELRGEESGHPVEKLSEMLQKTSDSKQKVELISTFYIPNTKEDIYDFFILSASMTGDPLCDEAWVSKLEQAYLKAKISFGNSSDFSELKALYNKSKKLHSKKQKIRIIAKNIRYIVAAITLVIGIIFLIFGYLYIEDSDGYAGLIIAGIFSILIAAYILLFGSLNKDKEKGSHNDSN